MKFLLDVNASGSAAYWLRLLGHDVVQVSDENPRMSDDQILSWAMKEGRIVITTDNDFEEMIWRQGRPHCGNVPYALFCKKVAIVKKNETVKSVGLTPMFFLLFRYKKKVQKA